MKVNVNKQMWWTRHVHERLALCVSLHMPRHVERSLRGRLAPERFGHRAEQKQLGPRSAPD